MSKWSIRPMEEEAAVCVTTDGIMDAPGINAMAADMLAAGQRLGFDKYLLDHRRMQPDVSTAAIYQMPKRLEAVGLTRRLMIALVYDPQATRREDFEFFETVALNQGFTVKLFTDREEALGWLRRGLD